MEEKKIISLVKKEQVEDVILKLVLIVVALMTLILNISDYREIFTGTLLINNNTSLQNALNEDAKYVTIDITKAKETRFSLEENNSEKAKLYELTYGEKNILLVLNKNTAITGKVDGELLSFDTNIKTISEKLIQDDKSKKYYDRYFSNMDFIAEKNLTKKKFYITTIIVSILLISIMIDFVQFFHPKNTRRYKRIYKKMYNQKRTKKI